MGMVKRLAIWTLVPAVIVLGAALVIVLLISRGAPLALMQQVQAELVPLGMSGAWHCLVAPTYSYDPSREVPDVRLVSERPETVLFSYLASGLEATMASYAVERVDVDVRSAPGTAVIWTRLRRRDGAEEERTFTLRASRTLRVSLDLPAVEMMLCNKSFGDWRVVE